MSALKDTPVLLQAEVSIAPATVFFFLFVKVAYRFKKSVENIHSMLLSDENIWEAQSAVF